MREQGQGQTAARSLSVCTYGRLNSKRKVSAGLLSLRETTLPPENSCKPGVLHWGQCLGIFMVVTGGCSGIEWVGARNAVQPPAMPVTAPHRE